MEPDVVPVQIELAIETLDRLRWFVGMDRNRLPVDIEDDRFPGRQLPGVTIAEVADD
jgi:hypothetical protein